jgi:hypothetical protein
MVGASDMGDVLRLPATDAQRALARFREEERSFVLVLEVLKEWGRDELFQRVFTLYRRRMCHLRKLAGSLLRDVEPRWAVEDLRRLGKTRERDP